MRSQKDHKQYLPIQTPLPSILGNVTGQSTGVLLIYLNELKQEHVLGKEMAELGEVLENI